MGKSKKDAKARFSKNKEPHRRKETETTGGSKAGGQIGDVKTPSFLFYPGFPQQERGAKKLWLSFLALSFVMVWVVSNAWLGDDAFITFRTIDNWFNGYGLRWNTLERVQSYTHPLWMFFVAGVYALWRDFYFSSMMLSLFFDIAMLGILFYYGARSTLHIFLGAMILGFSRAYVDFSTSGLENPLAHLLLVSAGVGDERTFYFGTMGLVYASVGKAMPTHDWWREGERDRARKLEVIEKGAVGMYGVAAGSGVHIVDRFALCDPLLARLPMRRRPNETWRVGHYFRLVPKGYHQAAIRKATLKDPDLRRYYEKIQLITRGALFSKARWEAIWGMHTGRYRQWLEGYRQRAYHLYEEQEMG